MEGQKLPEWTINAKSGSMEESFSVFAATLDDAVFQGEVIAREKGLDVISIVDPEDTTIILA